jgi:cob(I)alamin adenosyltransferase
VILPEDEQAFLCNALAQLEPEVRPVFAARMVEHLQALADPGVGDVDLPRQLLLQGRTSYHHRVNYCRAIRRAAEKLCIRVGRSATGSGRAVLWRLKTFQRS